MKQIGVFENGWEEVSSTTVQYYVLLLQSLMFVHMVAITGGKTSPILAFITSNGIQWEFQTNFDILKEIIKQKGLVEIIHFQPQATNVQISVRNLYGNIFG